MTETNAPKKIRVMVADDHAVLRAGLRLLIQAQPDMEVVAEAADGGEALHRLRETRPDVALLDLSMPGSRGTETIAAIASEHPESRVLVLTMHDDPAHLRASLAAGASGFVIKKVADTELITAIRAVHRGHTFVDLTRPPSAGATKAMPDGPAPGNRNPLSRRERQVLGLLARGYTNNEIAGLLTVSVKTIETYRGRLSEKLGLRGRAELFRFAAQSGLLAAEEESNDGVKV